MPYLRMFLNEEVVDEVFISDHLLQTVIGFSIIEEEKQKLLEKHEKATGQKNKTFSFCLDTVPSAINFFTPLKSTGGDS